MKGPSKKPSLAVTNVAAESADISNLQVAAVVYAFDVPLHPERPYDVQAGDGISGSRVMWHFVQDAGGESPREIAKKYLNDDWHKMNPDHPLAVCKRAFDEFAKLKQYLKVGGPSPYVGPACRITNTRQAAVLLALGHKMLGWQRNALVTTWCFHEAAAAEVIVREMDMPFMQTTSHYRLKMIAHLLLPLLEARRTKTQVIIVFLGKNGNDLDQKGSVVADCSRQ